MLNLTFELICITDVWTSVLSFVTASWIGIRIQDFNNLTDKYRSMYDRLVNDPLEFDSSDIRVLRFLLNVKLLNYYTMFTLRISTSLSCYRDCSVDLFKSLRSLVFIPRSSAWFITFYPSCTIRYVWLKMLF